MAGLRGNFPAQQRFTPSQTTALLCDPFFLRTLYFLPPFSCKFHSHAKSCRHQSFSEDAFKRFVTGVGGEWILYDGFFTSVKRRKPFLDNFSWATLRYEEEGEEKQCRKKGREVSYRMPGWSLGMR